MFTDAVDWINNMIGHRCTAGRKYDQDDSISQIGYTCDFCAMSFRIDLNDLKATLPQQYLGAFLNRVSFGKAISKTTLPIDLKNKTLTKDASSEGSAYYNRDLLINTGDKIYL